jgi:hypothetical protein
MNASPSSRGRRSDDIPDPVPCMRGWQCKLPVAQTSGHCCATVLYNENTNSGVWRRRRPAPSDTAQWVCGEQIVGQIASPPDPIINAQREGAVRNASWTRTRCRTRRDSETAARWFLIRLLNHCSIERSLARPTERQMRPLSMAHRNLRRYAPHRVALYSDRCRWPNNAAQGEWSAMSEYII